MNDERLKQLFDQVETKSYSLIIQGRAGSGKTYIVKQRFPHINTFEIKGPATDALTLVEWFWSNKDRDYPVLIDVGPQPMSLEVEYVIKAAIDGNIFFNQATRYINMDFPNGVIITVREMEDLQDQCIWARCFGFHMDAK